MPATYLCLPAVLLLYEGDAGSQAEAKVRVRMVDFAHTFFQQPGAEGGSGTIDSGTATDGAVAANSGAQQQQHQQSQQQQQQAIASPCCGNDAGNGVGSSSSGCGGAHNGDAGQGQAAGSAGPAGTAGPSRDDNFLSGLRALLARLRGVVHAQLEQDLAA